MNKFELSSPEVKTMVCDLLHQIEYEYSQEYKYELDENCKLSELLQKKQQELERYKNIIDELEKYINENKYQDTWGDTVILVGYLLDKLKELKGE